ncbi:hypothetical protein, partial [Mycoplasmopsis bovis]|uniref:hypothetical protein n=1 Tax=Mycoplasmopsis bovis TaxID=28903 RepID=UPI003D297522
MNFLFSSLLIAAKCNNDSSKNKSNDDKKIGLLSDDQFEISSDELTHASFEHFATDAMDRFSKPKIMFSNGDVTVSI